MFQKPTKVICLILLILGSTYFTGNVAMAQSPNSRFMAELSVTFMDYRALQPGGDFLQYKMFDPGITMAGHAYLNRALNFSLNTSFVPEADWVTEEGQFRATSLLDVNGMVQLKSNGTIFEEDALIAPYLATGFGMNTASNNIRLYVPATLGMRFQVSENFSLNFAATYKQKISQNQHQHMAYTAGFVFAMPGNKKGDDEVIKDPPKGGTLTGAPLAGNGKTDSDGDGVPDEDDLCPDVKGKVMYLGCPEGEGQEEEDIADIEPGTVTDIYEEPVEEDPIQYGSPSNVSDLGTGNVAKKEEVPVKSISAEDRDYLNYAMKNIFFEPASDKIKPESYSVLDEISRIMMKYPQHSLEVTGHTDNSGNRQNNVILSVMRAYRVKYYLVNEKGVKMSRISSDGQASDKPAFDNDTVSGRAKNRRVDLKLIPTSELQKSMFRGESIIVDD